MIENVYNFGGQETHLPNFRPHIIIHYPLDRDGPAIFFFLIWPAPSVNVIEGLIYLVKVVRGKYFALRLPSFVRRNYEAKATARRLRLKKSA